MASPHPHADGRRPAIRLGYHGSTLVVDRVVATVGWDRAEVVLTEYDVANPFAPIRAGDADVMITKFALDEPDLVPGRVLFSEQRAVVVGAAHPLADRAEVSIEELAAFEAFAPPGRMPDYLWEHIVPGRTPAGLSIRRVHRVATVPEMMERVTRTDAIHITVASLADLAPPSIRIIPIIDLAPAPVMLTWRRGRHVDHVQAFINDVERAVAL
ncbi:transcriptional regulator [Frankia torreyi]|uniref:Transcriptional regulator n=1 Tax=Frankia torreyi TaxID=1856 RepID=A0A0D8BCF4_9ACTN|nr:MULTISPECIES: LysR substrate-binding domain-containing protein [Frankia]KJE21077.1 transcriptional regulator [Frankia torreyi]KQM03655.1 transcriptional regulator [Frankia sp. CpI1-P]